jgi:hypothetical protein
MTINGQVGSFSRDEERAQVPGHAPVILSGKLTASDGVYPTGLVLTRNAAGVLIPLVEVVDEIIATGNGATQVYNDTLASFPVEPGTLAITDGVETFSDDGSGRLTGSAGGSGAINYKTGAISLDFNANVGNGTNITGDYVTAVDGVLDEQVDTAYSASGLYVGHGTVDSTVLKVGKTAKAAPSASLLMLLQRKGIFPK